jgi:hypothetical protein
MGKSINLRALMGRCVRSAAWGACIVGGSLQAQPAPLADQTNAMEAQIQILRKRAELNQAQALAAAPGLGPLPKVLAIYGFDGSLVARLLLPSGVVANYREGEVLRAGMKLAAITARSVMVAVGPERQRRTVALEFLAGAGLPPQTHGQPVPPAPMAPGAGLSPVPPELLPPLPAVNIGRAAPSGQ